MLKDCTLVKSGCPEPVSMRVLLSVLYPVLSLTIFGLYPSMVSFSLFYNPATCFISEPWCDYCSQLKAMLHSCLQDAVHVVSLPRYVTVFCHRGCRAKLHSKVAQFNTVSFTARNTKLAGHDLRGFTHP